MQLGEYFQRRRRTFSVPYRLYGTDWQRRVWAELEKVSYGKTTTYGAIAAALGKPGAARAVGAAVGRNPISVLVPCHRVLPVGGGLGGYAGGVDNKRALLQLEEVW